MGTTPLGRPLQFIGSWFQQNEVCEVFAPWTLVNCSVQLESDVVLAGRDPDGQTGIVSNHQTLQEAPWQPKIKQ